MHNAAILTRKNHSLHDTVNQLQKHHTRRPRALPNKGILTISKGRELAQELNQAREAPPSTN
jgi:hypothetical protein